MYVCKFFIYTSIYMYIQEYLPALSCFKPQGKRFSRHIRSSVPLAFWGWLERGDVQPRLPLWGSQLGPRQQRPMIHGRPHCRHTQRRHISHWRHRFNGILDQTLKPDPHQSSVQSPTQHPLTALFRCAA